MNFIIAFVTFAVIFAVIDAVWLKSTANLYKKELGHIMREKPNFVAAALFYVIYVAGITFSSLVPGIDAHQLSDALVPAAILAFVSYATYDLTNLSTIKGWSTKIVIIDIIWGTTATSVSVIASYLTLTEIFGL